MHRCFEIAKEGGKNTKSNPLVGAVLVHNNNIIGEGFHQKYGQGHAEVNCINSVKKENLKLIEKATLYISLEPCNHTGKTPPCSELILKHKIPRVVISCIDPFKKVNGSSIEKLRNHGVDVIFGVLEKEGKELIKKFKANINHRPYIIIKYAQSADLYIGQSDKRVLLSNEYTNVFTHKLRSSIDAILIGTNTAILDNPRLTARNYPGDNPIRLVIDKSGKIPTTHHILSDEYGTIIFSHVKRNLKANKKQIALSENDDFIDFLFNYCNENAIYSILVEGGAETIKQFLLSNKWDEAWVIKTKKQLGSGTKAPRIEGKLLEKIQLGNDELLNISNNKSTFC